MYFESDYTIKGRLTGETATYPAGDVNARQKAIEMVERVESDRQSELETRAGRPLSPAELLKGISHPETRSRIELQRLKIKATPQAEAPADGLSTALAYSESTQADAGLSIRERQDKRLREQIASREPEPTPPSEATIKLRAEASKFAQSVKFTAGATVEQVERASALVELADDPDAYQTALVELSADIKATIFDAPVADAQKNLHKLRERASLFDIQKPQPEPKPVVDPTDALGLYKGGVA